MLFSGDRNPQRAEFTITVDKPTMQVFPIGSFDVDVAKLKTSFAGGSVAQRVVFHSTGDDLAHAGDVNEFVLEDVEEDEDEEGEEDAEEGQFD